ncbi:MAG: preprotein translocase subunit SecE [Candidatus Aminicenantales bacterium]
MSKKERWYKRIGPFLKEVRAELRKVTWPTRSEVASTTVIVIIATVFFGVYLWVMDLIFSWIFLRIREFF